jgi:hypothetical protein
MLSGEIVPAVSPFLHNCKKDGICTGIWRSFLAKNAQISQVFWQADNLRNSPCMNGTGMMSLLVNTKLPSEMEMIRFKTKILARQREASDVSLFPYKNNIKMRYVYALNFSKTPILQST